MILGIMSDTHDNLPKVKNAVSLFHKKGVNFVLHCGDIVAPFTMKLIENNLKCDYVGVFGNNDGEKQGLTLESKGKIKEAPLTIEKFGKKILLTHDIESIKNIDTKDYDFVFFGHSHKESVDKKGNTWFINPGECGGWLTGKSTVVTFDIISDTPKVHRI